MEEKRYIISDASKILNVESHVLRYWEEELEINIPRNEMGHRYYTQKEIDKLKNVRDLKRQGYGLRSIRMMINGTVLAPQERYEGRFQNINRNSKEGEVQMNTYTNPIPTINKEEKLAQFKEIMGNIVKNAIKENQAELSKQIGTHVGDRIGEQIENQLGERIGKRIGDQLEGRLEESLGREIKAELREQEKRAEARYKKLDETMRLKQKNTRKKSCKEKGLFINCSNSLWKKMKKPQLD